MSEVLTAKVNESARSYFSEAVLNENSLIHCVEPLLSALHWQGNKRRIAESLPHMVTELSEISFCETMSKLGYSYKKEDFNELYQKGSLTTPFLLITTSGISKVVQSIKDGTVNAFCGRACETEQLKLSDLSGSVFLFKQKSRTNKKSLNKDKWVTQSVKEYKGLIRHVLSIALVLNLFTLATPIFIMSIYDRVIGTGQLSMLASFCVGISIVLLGGYVLTNIRTKIFSYIAAKLDEKVGKHIISQLLTISPSYTENASIGPQVSRIKDFDSVRQFLSSPLSAMLFDIPFVFLLLGAVAIISGKLVFVPLTAILCLAITAVVLYPRLKSVVNDAIAVNSEKHSFLIESLKNLRTIKSQNSEQKWIERHRTLSKKIADKNYRTSILTSVNSSIADFVTMLSGLFILAFGSHMVIQGTVSVGALIATMMITWRILGPFKVVFTSTVKLDQIKKSLSQVNKLMEVGTEEDLSPELPLDGVIQGRVSFQRVSFRYLPETDPVISGVSFDIKPKELIMVTGPSCGGKTTLFKLMLRMYQPQAGNIFVDDKELKHYSVNDLRFIIGYVPQVDKFFYGTIEQNLQLANALATREEMEHACRLAGVFDEINNLPEKFDTRLKEHTSNQLSSSFQRRLAIARALVRRPSILLLDEPSFSLDQDCDEKLLSTIREINQHITVIMITHRPSHLKLADRIMILDQGFLVAFETPDKIMPQLEKGIV